MPRRSRTGEPLPADAVVRAAREELWRRGEIAPLLLHEGQRAIYDRINALPESTREVACKIGRRWGKTWLMLVISLEKCLRTPGTQVIFCAPSAKQAMSIVVPVLREITKDIPRGLVKPLKSELRWSFTNGSQITLGGFDTASEAFRGLAADYIVADEGGATNPETFLYVTRSVLMPTMLGRPGARIVHTYTPAPVPDHPIHTVVEARARLRDAFFSFPTTASPLYGEQELAEMCQEVGGPLSLAWEREYLVKDRVDTNRVCVPEFDEKLHVAPVVIPRHTLSWISVDVGGVRDLTAFQSYVYDPAHDRVLVVAEHTLPANPTHAQIADGIARVRARIPRESIIVADAPGPTRSELSQVYGESVIFPTKPKDGFHPGLVMVREALAGGRLIVDPSCKLLIATLRSAMFNASRSDFLHNELSGHADHLACLIYGYRHRQTQVRIPQSKTQEEVMQAQLQAMDEAALRQDAQEWWEQ
jgi:hypothetical protein